MEWIIRTQLYVPLITHYVDDTFIANRTEQLCARDLASTKAGMAELGVPDAADKTERPATALTYLGIRIDSVDMSISLDASRLASLLELLDQWCARTTCFIRQLRSLIGTLQLATYVVRHGRTFLQHLRDSRCTRGLLSPTRRERHCSHRLGTRRPSLVAAVRLPSETASDSCGPSTGSIASRLRSHTHRRLSRGVRLRLWHPMVSWQMGLSSVARRSGRHDGP